MEKKQLQNLVFCNLFFYFVKSLKYKTMNETPENTEETDEELPEWLQPMDGVPAGITDLTIEDAQELKDLLISLGYHFWNPHHFF